jgi:hypothetical protein
MSEERYMYAIRSGQLEKQRQRQRHIVGVGRWATCYFEMYKLNFSSVHTVYATSRNGKSFHKLLRNYMKLKIHGASCK